MSKRKLFGEEANSSETAAPVQVGDSGGSWRTRMVDAHEWERQHEAEWVRVDQKLRGLAARRAALDAEEANLLRYAEELKLWRGWAFGSMLEYMERAMGYAPHTAAERLRVARSLAELPLLAEALERGRIPYSAVRELSRVAVPETEAIWLEAAQGKCLREIEASVSGHRPGDLPDDPTEPRLHRRTITLELSPESYDLWRRLHALAAEEHGQRLSDDELIPALFRRAYGESSTRVRTGALAAPGAASTAPGAAHVIIGAAGTTVAITGVAATSAATFPASTTAGAAAPSATATTGTVAPGAAAIIADSPAHGASGVARANASGSAASGTMAATGAVDSPAMSGPPDACGAPAVFGTTSPAYKIALKRCPDCGRAWQYSGGRDIEVASAVLELAACDAVLLGSLDAATPERATTTVTPRKREQVLARDGHCCTVPGCRRNVGLDLHHIEYQSRGGDHSLTNLTTLCDLHHRAVHFEKLAIRGAAPDRLTFEFRGPRDRRNVTDDDAPPPGATAPLPRATAPLPRATAPLPRFTGVASRSTPTCSNAEPPSPETVARDARSSHGCA